MSDRVMYAIAGPSSCCEGLISDEEIQIFCSSLAG